MTTRSKLDLNQKPTEENYMYGRPSKKRTRHISEREVTGSSQADGVRNYAQSTSAFDHTTMTTTTTTTAAAAAAMMMGDWDDETHRNFVSAIFEVGMKNSSPAVIMENMIDQPIAMTSERVKSKLQKFRNSKDKATKEFMDEYDACLARLNAVCPAPTTTQENEPDSTSTTAILQLMGCPKLVGGDAAALVSFVLKNELAMNNTQSGMPPWKMNNRGSSAFGGAGTPFHRRHALDYVEDLAGTGIPFPNLSEEERKTSLGLSLLHVKELFQSMRHHLNTSRGIGTKTD